ncbi:hypothetical protein [Methylophaga sp. OBS4]|uniref:hypothetical protein n=1 Tax=Methylophaga sp. OBS4 TaxID=2991935 RepID=UPI00224C82C2|nr:hypothetical protein [Methylophaga sp. OBS4]MCX4186655.1 hypothetical protein [Methylophaga sp. OBS4]
MAKKIIGITAIVAALGFASYGYADYQATAKVKKDLDQVAADINKSGQGDLSYEAVKVSLLTEDVVIRNARFTPNDPSEAVMQIAKLTFSDMVLAEGQQLPTKMKIDMTDAVITVNNVDALLGDMDSLQRAITAEVLNVENNTAVINYNAQLGYELNPVLSLLDIYSNYDAEGMAASDFSIQFANMPTLDAEIMNAAISSGDTAQALQQQQLFAAFSDTSLKQLTLSLQDKGLAHKIYTAIAQDPKVSETLREQGDEASADTVRNIILQELDKEISRKQGSSHQLELELLTHAREFLASDNPGMALTLTALKPEGLTFTDILMLVMMGGHPDIANKMVKLDIQTH